MSSRRPPPGPGFVRGDLETGAGLAAAVDGVGMIAHCASAADHRRPQRDVTQTRRLLDAVRGARPHLVYVSIVGVDRIPFGLFRAKLDAERLVEDSGVPWTILRAAQFHDLMLMFVMRSVPARSPWFRGTRCCNLAARVRFRASSTATAWSQLVRTALWPSGPP